jgi:hypothetical protein
VKDRLKRIIWPGVVIAGRALAAMDSTRFALLHERGDRVSVPEHDSEDVQSAGVVIAVSHWRSSAAAGASRGSSTGSQPAERLRYLLKCIAGVLQLSVERVVVAVITNEPVSLADDLLANTEAFVPGVPIDTISTPADFSKVLNSSRRIVCVRWRPGLFFRHGYYLTWAHKHVFKHAIRDPAFSHFIYLEDDIQFTDASFRYWCRFRGPLASHGLLPGFVRFERQGESSVVVDQTNRLSLSSWPGVAVDVANSEARPPSRLLFVNLPRPYQGMYVLDRAMAVQHFLRSQARTPLRSKWWSHWGIRERAAIGPIFDDPPPGFPSRNVVPVRTEGESLAQLDESCLVEHLSGTYSRSPDSHFGKIEIKRLFLPRCIDA